MRAGFGIPVAEGKYFFHYLETMVFHLFIQMTGHCNMHLKSGLEDRDTAGLSISVQSLSTSELNETSHTHRSSYLIL